MDRARYKKSHRFALLLCIAARFFLLASLLTVVNNVVCLSGPQEDFDLCMGVNIDGLRRVVDLFRALQVTPKLVSASSIAALPALPVAGDSHKLSGATTYGMTKAFTELFVNDCTRRNFIDGRSARLPTIIPRPGAPNKVRCPRSMS